MFDRHIHSKFSFDSHAEPKDIISAAESAGLTEICITDHVDLGFVPLIDFDDYFSTWNGLKSTTKVKIKIGVELGFDKRYTREAASILKNYPFEFVVNSIHAVDGIDIFFSEYYAGKSRETAYKQYLNAILQAIDAPYEFNSVGHIGYIERCSPYAPVDLLASEFPEMTAIAKAIINRGVVPEINTNGGKLNQPREDFLRLYKSLGGKAVVTSSDAHTPNRVGENIARAQSLAQSIGLDVI